VRARWAREAPPDILGFNEPTAAIDSGLPAALAGGLLQIQPSSDRIAVGRFGSSGELGIAVLGSDLTQSRIHVSLIGSSATVVLTRPGIVSSIGVLRGQSRDSLVAFRDPDAQAAQGTTDSLLEELMAGGMWTTLQVFPGLDHARRIRSFGPCDSGSSEEDELVLELFPSGSPESSVIETYRKTAPATPELALPPETRILSSGCATDVAGDLVRTLAHVAPTAGVVHLIVDADRVREAPTLLLNADLAFTPAIGDDPAYLVGNTAEIDGISLDRFLIEPLGSGALSLQESASDPDDIIGLALSTVGGDFDGDDVLDIAALLAFGVVDGRTEYRIFVSLGGVEYHGGRLVGLSRPGLAFDPKLTVVDDNDDGFDDLVISSLTGTALLRLGPI
jgi:hypothetical protein